MLKWFADRLAQTGKRVGREEKGFTLIELLIVIIIIGILAAIAIPTFLAQRENGQQAGCVSDTRSAANAAISYGATNQGNYSALAFGDLTANGFRQSAGNTTTVTNATAANFELTTACASGGTDAATFNSANGIVNDNF